MTRHPRTCICVVCRPPGEEASAREIELATALAESRNEARTDPLTDLPNCRAWEEATRTKRRADEAFSFVLLDLTNLHTANHRLGHAGGDELLREVGRCIRTQRGDTACRYGGDEFACILPGDITLVGANKVRERLEEAFEAVEVAPGVRCRLVGAIGSWLPGQDWEACLVEADAALEARKREIKLRAGEVLTREAAMGATT